MKVRVLFFAQLRERARTGEAVLELAEGTDVATLWDQICGRYPDVEPLAGSISFAVNREYVGRDCVLAADDEIALIPPVSGG